jgi:Zn finger protein HypA/HybF involved in hydrogenase expression
MATNTTKKIVCHDCEAEIIIKDKHDEIALEDLKYCPICGSDNIETE